MRGAECEHPEAARSGWADRGTLGIVSQADRVATEHVEELDADDRAWLDERLTEYSELLTYLREH